MQETDLYPPVKAFLEAQGYTVKAEVGAADVVACRRDGPDAAAPPLIVELKTGFSLALFHQGIARLALSDAVYLAVPRGRGRRWQRALRDNVKLARRLGLGLLTVRLPDGRVEVHCDPGPYVPRRDTRRQAALLREFAERRGDPNLGGARGARMTAYRQDAIACAAHLSRHGPCKGAAVRDATGVARATTLMRDNHYGWFQRVATGVYALSPAGAAALAGAA
jgi:hypothetical protein